MKPKLLLLVLIAAILAACAPVATVTPEELVANTSFDDAFRQVVSAINRQPYPANTGGWVITNSDQIGGFISTELNGNSFILFQGSVPYRALVSVSLVVRTENTTSVNISANNQKEAQLLGVNIREALGL